MTPKPADLRSLYDRLGPEGYKRSMQHACWRAGRLDYLLHRGQRDASAMVHRIHRHAVDTGGVKRALLNIARRWGKTYFFVVFCVELMLRKPGARIPYAAMSEVSVREFVEPILRALARDAPAELAPREYKNEWIIPAGQGRPETSRLIVKGCEDRSKADRLRGPAADAFVVDEAGFIPILDYVIESVASAQLSTTDGMMLVGSSAPESPEHEFWRFATEAEERGAYMHATVYDAPHLTAKQIRSFAAEVGGEDTVAWQREGLSRKVVDITKAVYPEWAEGVLHDEKHPGKLPPLVADVERPEHFDTYVVGDLGFSDMTVVLLGYYDFRGARLVIVDEVETRRQTSDVIAAKVSAVYAEHFEDRKPFVRKMEGDAHVVASIRKEERIARGEAKRGEAEEDAPIEESAWRQIAFVQMEAAVNAARLRIKRRGLVVSPRCKVLIAHLGGAIWNKTRTDFERIKGPSGHHFDGAAALAYLVRELRPERNPYPNLPPGVHYHTHRVPPELMKDARIEKLKKAFTGRRERR